MLATTLMQEMTFPEIQQYIEFSQREYAQGMLDQGEYPDYETALRAARTEINHYYNATQAGESHNAYHVVNASTGEKVGLLAFSILRRRDETKAPFVFVDYISVFPLHRRSGHARFAMRWLEEWAQQHKINCIDLNVMKHKKGAVKLYQALGYDVYRERALGFAKEPGRYDMRKKLV